MKRFRNIFLGGLLGIAILVLRPLPQASYENTIELEGKITYMEEGSSHDVIIRLDGDAANYYINRGLENSLQLSDLRFLKGSRVQLRYIKHFTPIDPSNLSRHIAELKLGDRVLYTEMKE